MALGGPEYPSWVYLPGEPPLLVTSDAQFQALVQFQPVALGMAPGIAGPALTQNVAPAPQQAVPLGNTASSTPLVRHYGKTPLFEAKNHPERG